MSRRHAERPERTAGLSQRQVKDQAECSRTTRPGRRTRSASWATSTAHRGGWRKRSGSTGRRWTSTCVPATRPRKDAPQQPRRTLLRLGRHDQARTELAPGPGLQKPYGHAAQPWTTWELLEELEHATGHPDAAHTARHQAIATYLAYRHAGGASQTTAIELFDHVAQAITHAPPTRPPATSPPSSNRTPHPGSPHWSTPLQALLAGDPEPARTDHPDLDPRDVAELHLLLASLAEPPPETTDG